MRSFGRGSCHLDAIERQFSANARDMAMLGTMFARPARALY